MGCCCKLSRKTVKLPPVYLLTRITALVTQSVQKRKSSWTARPNGCTGSESTMICLIKCDEQNTSHGTLTGNYHHERTNRRTNEQTNERTNNCFLPANAQLLHLIVILKWRILVANNNDMEKSKEQPKVKS